MSNMVTVDGETFDAGSPEAADLIRKRTAEIEAKDGLIAGLEEYKASVLVSKAQAEEKIAELQAELAELQARNARIERMVDEGLYVRPFIVRVQ